MDRSKLVAIVTGAIALLLGIAYLLLVQILDFRGEMIPAPVDGSMEMRSSPVSGSMLPWSIFLLNQSH
ncbi:MAG: hypothetical protein HC881_05760 [Leptolyngbyaceae cyanobacterium SL_7_1]|nr:hypothetical protein [Leptolyngbyaceae cyanobacterium SL_7_1]